MGASTPEEERVAPSGDEPFLRRWSRRKRAASEDATTATEPVSPEGVAGPEPPAAPVLTDADMPPIESLTPESDFSGFMSPGVSEALRRKALRVLFRAPQFNTRCPLDGEYYDCAHTTPLGSIVTHDMREEMEREAKKRLAALGSEARADEPPAAGAAGTGETVPPAPGAEAAGTKVERGESDA
ncbi:hypothetical protein SVA_2338 [Sulfurifustis variabilis]|uniref:DUF3306 domain-containing protein n=1 Tax=Sulfurifustis variabilis TaxID=1675686 RepID=A0A1B4V5U0_9GAMM|nr:DUF3306 domain-containing protein [Sulfurifustis variabilis]BAU48888.1 hypothetical protein SVA_2338 [Sulfurifustis variabilis]